MPDSSNLSSALDEAVTEGRRYLTRVESLADALTAELATHAEAAQHWSAEREELSGEAERLRGQIESFTATLVELRQALYRAQQEREQVTADRDRLRQVAEAADREMAGAREKLEAAEREATGFETQLAASTAEAARVREQLAMVTRDRDALQTDQIQWGLDRERLLAEASQIKAQAAELEKDLADERELHQALQTRNAELTEQANKVAADWVARRQALAAEIMAQNAEIQQVRNALEESQAREGHGTGPVSVTPSSPSPEQSHLINSTLNAVVGFSSVLLDERVHGSNIEERREYLKYIHDNAVKLSEAVRSLMGSDPSGAEAPPVLDREGPSPDILVADNDVVSRQRIEPFLKRAGYEVVYVDNGPRALEKASHLQPLAMLIDAHLPLSGAVPLIREIRKDPRTRDIPLVVMTGPDGPAMTLPDVEVLSKPIDRQQLVQMMVRFDLMADSKRAKKMPANVLVIDDDQQAISLVKAVLKPFNVRVSAVDNAHAGIEQALRNKPDLVILDLVMPGADGFEVIAALRRVTDMGRIPILVHTAKTLTPEDRQRLDGMVESIVEKAEFQPERFVELLLKRGERRKHAA